jgi:biotin carboxylase
MHNPARLLLLMSTTTYRAGAFLKAAERLGVEVVVGTEQPQVLSGTAPGRYLTLDFNQPESASGEVLSYTESQPVDAILAAEDEGLVLAALSAEPLGLVHSPYEAVATARDKYRMREALAAANVPVPEFRLISLDEDPEELAEQVRYPGVLKPLFLSASRGVVRVNQPAEFLQAYYQIREILSIPDVAVQGGPLARNMLYEGYIPGVEVAVEGLLVEGVLQVLAIFDKPDPLEGPYFEETIYVTPSRLPPDQQQAIESCTSDAARALGLKEGPVHAELRLNPSGPWVIEVAPRTIGGLCSRTLRFVDESNTGGISLEELILRHALRRRVAGWQREPLAAGVMMIPVPRTGILKSVSGLTRAKEVAMIEDIIITVPPGKFIEGMPAGNRYLGFIFARGARPEGVEGALREAHSALNFEITPMERLK